jgi:hypothetical protein
MCSTALGMYDYIKEAIARGDCLLEWDSHLEPAPVPLLKDKFASERRKAKVRSGPGWFWVSGLGSFRV